jgi:hypothetical protein
MLTLLKLELEKLFRSRNFYLSFLMLIGFVDLMLWGFYTYAARKAGGEAVEQFRYTYESKQYFNGLTFALYSVLFSFTFTSPNFCGDERWGANRRGGPLRHPANDMHSSDLSRFSRNVEISRFGITRLSAIEFLYRIKSVGWIGFCRLGKP